MTITKVPGVFGGKQAVLREDGTCGACSNCIQNDADLEQQAYIRQNGGDVEIIGAPRPCLRAPQVLRDRSALGV